jgi:hypothetical protein
MPRFTPLFRLFVLAALVALLSRASVTAQDAKSVKDDATANIKKIREGVASGKFTDDKMKEQTNPNLSRLRIEKFEIADKDVKVYGTFLDTGVAPKAGVDSPTFAAVRADAEKLIRAAVKTGEVQFDWTEVQRIGAPVDGAGKPQNEKAARLPHLVVQEAANKAGAAGNSAADRLVVTGARFNAAGEVVLGVMRDASDAEVEKWLNASVKEALKGHAVATFEGKPAAPSWENAKESAGLKWTASAKAIQAVLAGARPTEDLKPNEAKGMHRLFVSRAYSTPPAKPDEATGWDRMEFRVEGFRSGTAALFETGKGKEGEIEGKVRALITPVWKKMTRGTVAEEYQINTEDLLSPLKEPVLVLQQAVSANRALDGVRVDPGFEFDETGKLLLGGLQPELNKEALETLEAVVRKALTAHSADKGHSEETAQKYKLLAAQPVSVAGMSAVPINQVRKDLHDWAMRNKDDVRLRRLYFVLDANALAGQHYAVAKNGAGLVLVYQATSEADLKAVEDEFERIFVRHFPKGVPAPKAGDEPSLKAVEPPKAGAKDKEPPLPGLTAHVRAIVTANKNAPPEKNPWYGVFIERGYFDENDRYTIRGAVDTAEQNEALRKLLDQLSGEAKWKGYFTNQDGAAQPAEPPKLEVIPMGEMLTRIRRVTPAHPEFDGVRVEGAYYSTDADREALLVFQVHAVGEKNDKITPEMVARFADLLVDHPRYRNRVTRPDQPRDPRAPRAWPKLSFKKVSGPEYPGEWIGSFSVGFGAELLANGEMEKAKKWLDVGLLHYPNISGVWFLSAYYNHLQGDSELVARDLKRVIDLEVLTFDGDKQRRARYESAKDLQGPKRITLEHSWLIRYREVKDGAKPITLVTKP